MSWYAMMFWCSLRKIRLWNKQIILHCTNYAIHSLPQPAHLTDLPTVYMSTYRQVALNWQHTCITSFKKKWKEALILAELDKNWTFFGMLIHLVLIWCFIIRKSAFRIWPCHGKGPTPTPVLEWTSKHPNPSHLGGHRSEAAKPLKTWPSRISGTGRSGSPPL